MILYGLEQIAKFEKEQYNKYIATVGSKKGFGEEAKSIEMALADINIDGVEHFEGTPYFDEETEDYGYLVYHVDKNNTVIGVAGNDQTSYKAWLDVIDYCKSNGLNYDGLMEATREHGKRFEAAWRIKYPEKAREYDAANVVEVVETTPEPVTVVDDGTGWEEADTAW